MAKKKFTRKVAGRFESELKSLMVYAFGFVAALVWVDVIKSFFTDILGLVWGETFFATFYVAIAVTFFAVVITMLLGKKK